MTTHVPRAAPGTPSPQVRTRSLPWDFTGAGGHRLSGRLELPVDGEPTAIALYAHCFTCGKDGLAAARTARLLAQRSTAVLRFDFTGVGGSEGEFADTDFSGNVADLVCAAAALTERLRPPTLLVGHSLGGAAVLAAAHRVPGVRAVATIGAPSHPAHLRRHFSPADRERIRRDGVAEVTLAGRPFRVGEGLLRDVVEQPQRELIASLPVPLLVLHSPDDRLVDPSQAREIHDAAGDGASLVWLHGADHLLTDRADAERAAQLISSWAAPLLAAPG
ncbi:alpha/beta hydrolase family protein [Streptomyces spiramenti]|uniref:Alpha/beta hydrolase n=1 Tax=Streptomyces spiramenti TaxID=2720606 RepID=A0ABX1AKF7_9ACTN|nr:alpha/beta fold hydrolase [Streptomyces spiramenti]NJP64872.1 alpha/beta hydrolase [Streptomyces spiramenti]